MKGECNKCENEYVLKEKQCIHYLDINNCLKEENSKCSKCSFWHRPNEIGTHCDSHIELWLIVIGSLFVLLIVTSVN